MQELDVEGLFWRPEAPDREIAGRLRFDPTDGAILSFIEPLRFSRTENTRMSLTDLLGGQSEDKDANQVSRSCRTSQIHFGSVSSLWEPPAIQQFHSASIPSH